MFAMLINCVNKLLNFTALFNFLLILFFLGSTYSFSQEYQRYPNLQIEKIWFGSLNLGDYDNDNDLDILLTGLTQNNQIISKVYSNNGNNTFIEQESIHIPGVFLSSAVWVDFNNDSYLDILLTGNTSLETNNSITKIFVNNKNNTFSELTTQSFPGVFSGTVACGDYNNDGRIDFILSGQSTDSVITIIYKNEGDFIFSEQSQISLPPLKNSSIDWGDYDIDGDLDLVVTGLSIDGLPLSKIFQNNGDNTFTENFSVHLPGVSNGKALWGDFNNDGKLDLFLVGKSQNEFISKILLNSDNNSFTDINLDVSTDLYYPSTFLADLNNDGSLDIFLTGVTTDSLLCLVKIFLNNGNQTFTELNGLPLPGIYFGSAVWGDIDNDNDLDLLITGRSNVKIISELYLSTLLAANTPPSPPTQIFSTISENEVVLKWNRGLDAEIATNGLMYNVSLGSKPNQTDIYSPNSDKLTGYRRILELGNLRHDTMCVFKDLPKGRYYFSVQSVDNTFSGSLFSEEHSFINYLPFTELNSVFLQPLLYSSVAWGDYDNDGFLDFAIIGSYQTDQGFSKIYRNNGDNTFTEQTQINLIGAYAGSVAWGDYNNDGYIDLVLSGYKAPNLPITRLYRNNGNNTFTEKTDIPFVDVALSSLAWGDYNNDGKLDLLITGVSSSGITSRLYKNNGNETFTEQPQISLIPVAQGSTAWADYNKDGYSDLLITGTSGFLRTEAKLYLNNGDNTFSEQTNIRLTGVYNSSVAWGDYDSDGYLDILLTGYNGNIPISKIYRNNRNNSFTEQSHLELIGVQNGSVAWGDYDNDGLIDCMLTGTTSDGSQIFKIYRNNGNNTFTDLKDISIPGIRIGAIALADFDNDNDLDILLTGYTGSNALTKIYQNNCHIINNRPNPPNFLNISIHGSDVYFTWNHGFDVETPEQALNYNLVIGTVSNEINILSPMSNINSGQRNIISLGNAFQDTFYVIKNLKPGAYYWSVQALDNSYLGSNFSNEQYFEIGKIKVIPQGLYNEISDRLNLSDTVHVYLRENVYPYNLVDSTVVKLDSLTFSGSAVFTNNHTGMFILGIKHRNSLETWSELNEVIFNGNNFVTYDFTSDSAKVLGANVIKMNNRWCLYSGDVNQDGLIDDEDLNIIYYDMNSIQSGYYLTSDLNADGYIDSDDTQICYNNKIRGVAKVTPY